MQLKHFDNSQPSKKKGKQYPKPKGGFRISSNARIWTRAQDVDTAIYYPDRKKK